VSGEIANFLLNDAPMPGLEFRQPLIVGSNRIFGVFLFKPCEVGSTIEGGTPIWS
jgi:hypothetical protein